MNQLRSRIAALFVLALGSIWIACGGGGGGGGADAGSTDDTTPPVLQGTFKTGQDADLMLSGIDFNNTGGALLFNHQGGIDSDGTRIFLADRNNNRVLVWNTLPAANVAPDLVLGQPDFFGNDPGTGLDRMDWPVAVTARAGRLVVADTYNDRLLIWNSIPAANGTAADLEIRLADIPTAGSPLGWPWGVWTDGTRLVCVCTQGSVALIWDSFPAQAAAAPSRRLTASGMFGTPRTVTSDGNALIVGDHNAQVPNTPGNGQGNFVWRTFPTAADQPYDYFTDDPIDPRAAWLQGDFTSDGRLALLGRTLHVWNALPANGDTPPDLSIQGYQFEGGDGSDVAFAGGRLYISTSNGNKVVVYSSVPTQASQAPDFAIGAPDINTNTLLTNGFITNPVPASNGTSLLVTSDFDRRLSVWRSLPTVSGTPPDAVATLQDPAWDNALYGNTFVAAGQQAVSIWTSLPLNGEAPTYRFAGGIGSVQFQELKGVALDAQYLYLSDAAAGRIYVWEGIPSATSEPRFTIPVDPALERLSCDGTYLCGTSTRVAGGAVRIFRVSELSSSVQPVLVGTPGLFNLPMDAMAANGRFYIADTVFSRVLVWSRVEDALAGVSPDIVLGAASVNETRPEIGRDKLFWPGALSWDGRYLWVGEFKFSGRLVRFSPSP